MVLLLCDTVEIHYVKIWYRGRIVECKSCVVLVKNCKAFLPQKSLFSCSASTDLFCITTEEGTLKRLY